MTATLEFVEFIHELLQPLGELQQGRMFGGLGFKIGSKQFAMIMHNTLYFCVNDQTRPNYEQLGMQPFSYATRKGTVLVKRYYTVPEALLEEQEELLIWARAAIAVALAG